MPRFSDREKEIIAEKLFSEGERLFTLHGIKKVTVDDLVKAAGIAKGSFYAFYTSKEHLYMDILGRLQKKVWEDMSVFLEENRSLPPKELTKQVILWSLRQLKKYPLLSLQNGETTDYLFRKLPQEVMAAHTREDEKELEKLQEYGVRFKCGTELATQVFQALVITFFNLQNEKNADAMAVMEILIKGAVNELVGEDHD